MKRNVIYGALRRVSAALIPALVLICLSLFLLVANPSFAAVTFRSAASAGSASGGGITYVGVGTVAQANGGSISPGYPAGWQAGDLLLCIIEARDNVVLSMPAGWAMLSAANSGAAHRATIFWKIAAASDDTTPTVTHTGGNSIVARIIGFNGVDTTTPFDVANSFTVSGADLTTEAAAITTASPNAMLVFTAHMADNHTSIGVPAGSTPWTQAFFNATNQGNDSSIAAYYGLRAAAGVQAAVTATRAGAANAISHGAQIALRPIGTSMLTIAKPAGTVTADVMLASVAVTSSGVSIAPPVGWTLVSQFTQGAGGSTRLATYYRVAGVGEPASYTWTFTGVHAGAVGGIESFSGVDNAAPIDAQQGNTSGSSLTHTAPSVTTTQVDGMLVTIHAIASAATWTPPGGMTEAVDVASQAPNNAAGVSLSINYQARPTAGATGTRAAVASANADTGAVHSVALKATPLICYTDDFNRADGAPGVDWIVSSTSGTFGNPMIFNNRLRLTDASNQVSTTATLQRLFPGAGNRIEIEFDQFAYGGNGADGIAVTLSDSAVAPVPGAFGGSLGYAQKSNPGSDCTVPGGCPGFAGGWIGIGIDEFGNFSNPSEGRVLGPGQRPDAVAIRGSGSGAGATYAGGLPNYAYHTGTATLTPGIDVAGATPGPGHRYRIIVDHSNTVNAMVSVERDTGGGFATLISPYDAKAQTGQANVPNGWLLSYTGSTGGARNIHEIDNLQVCATSQTAVSGIHHFEITVAPSASTCSAQSVTIVAKDISGNTLTGYTGTVTITTSTAHGDWGAPAVNGTADDGVATYAFGAGDNGVVTLPLTNTHADDLTVNVTDPTVPASSTTSAQISFRDSAFEVINDPIQVAGRDQTITVRLLTAGSCNVDINYTGSRNLDAWLIRDPSDPGATAPTLNGVSLPGAAPASNPASNNLTGVSFANGVATLTLATTDVGKYVLNVRDDTRIYATAVDLGGASPSILTRPWLHAVAAGNPGANAAGGTVYTSAGTNFSITVRGVLWQAADDANDDGVPDVGADLANNAATPSYAWATVLSAAAPFTPATPLDVPAGTAVAGVLNRGAGGSTAPLADFSAGVATHADWRYSEVGSFTLLAGANNYLNSGVSLVTANGVIGRFTPAYFNVAVTHGCPDADAAAPDNSFTYSGQPFRVTVTAWNALAVPGMTQNYHSVFGFAKNVVITHAGNGANFLNNVVPGASAFSGGTGSTFPVANPLTGPNPPIVYTFPTKEAAPGVLTLRATDTDGVSSLGQIEQQTEVRSGRIQIQNAAGSELVDLAMPMRVQYYLDAANGFVTNGADTCTGVSLGLSNALAGATCVQDSGSPGLSGVGCVVAGPLLPVNKRFREAASGGFAGDFNLFLRAPAGGVTGVVDVSADLASTPWLRFDWDGDGVHDNDPRGRAGFGIYRGSPRQIYRRERY